MASHADLARSDLPKSAADTAEINAKVCEIALRYLRQDPAPDLDARLTTTFIHFEVALAEQGPQDIAETMYELMGVTLARALVSTP